MSTRAIIGIKNADGTILGAWQWCDGNGLTSLLNKTFNTLEKAMSLINQGMWSTMFTQKEKDKYENWLINDLYKDRPENVPYKSYTYINGLYLLRDKPHENRNPEIYQNYEDAAGQDINHTYLFNPVINKWVKDKDI